MGRVSKMLRGIVILFLMMGALCFGSDDDGDIPTAKPARKPDYAATSERADIALYLEKYGPTGSEIYCLIRIRAKERGFGFHDAGLLKQIFTIRNKDGELVPFTRYGTSQYDHRIRIFYKGKFLLLDEYLKIVNPSAVGDKKDDVESAPASYQNRLHIVPLGEVFICLLDLSRLYDISLPGRYVASVDWSFVADERSDGKSEKFVIENITFTVPSDARKFIIHQEAGGGKQVAPAAVE